VVLQGERVTLRPFREDEADHLFDVMVAWPTDGGVSHADGPPDREKIREKVAMSGSWSDGPLGLLLAIEADGRLVGELQARGGRAQLLPSGVFELGIELYAPEDRGRGLGTAAVEEITRYLFDEEQAHRVQISTDVENAAMRRACERAGFGYEGVLRGFMPTSNGPRDYAMYAVTTADHAKG
jgi:RimJ/RimL family protein N-acetyltransferase